MCTVNPDCNLADNHSGGCKVDQGPTGGELVIGTTQKPAERGKK